MLPAPQVLFRRGVEEPGVRGRLAVAAIGILTVVSACGKPAAPPLESVAPLAAPSAPAWIKQIAPLGNVTSSAQIRVIFANPVIPVAQLGSASEKDLLAHFRVAPALAGSFVVLTPRMIGFQSDSALPRATRVRVTLTSGLRDLSGHALDRDLAWTFETDPIVLKNEGQSPDATPTPPTVSLRPVVRLSSNTQLEADSLGAAAVFHSAAGDTPAAAAQESPDPSSGSWSYAISPQSDLQKDTAYTLMVKPGVLPKAGNLPSAETLSVAMHTYSPLAFVSVRPTADPMTSTGNPRFTGGDPVLIFNNALDPKTYAAHISVQPSPRPVGQLYSLSDDGTTVSINPYALAPKTGYTLSADAALQDIYGQQLGRDARGQFAAGNLSPYFWAPSGFNMFVASQNLQLQYSAVNLPGNSYHAAYHAFTPAELTYTDESDVSKILPDPSRWPVFGVKAAPNAQIPVNVSVRERLGNPMGILAYGAQAGTNSGNSFTGSVALTNLGIFAQWFPQSANIMVQRLSDGAPVAGAPVSVYVMHMYGQGPVDPNPRPCAAGTTGAGGGLALATIDLVRCYAGNRPADQAPELLTVARSGSDWSFVRTYAWSGAYSYTLGNLDATWSNGQPISRGVIYSDRQMYQPGERGWLTAVCYVLQNGTLKADANARYSIVLTDPNGGKRTLPAQTTNRYAGFSFPVTFSKTQPLGYYTVTATGPSGVQMTGNFRVAEFHPPNFSVDLSLDRSSAAAGGSVNAAGVAKYLFGAPMGGASATFHVTREQTAFTPKGWDDFTFGRQWFWPEQQPDASGDVGQQSITLDSEGKGSYAVTVPQDLPYAMTYRVDLEATDASHLTSSATQTFIAVPGSSLIGLRSDFVGTVNVPIPVGVIVTDPSGKAQSGSGVHLELQKMQYSGVTQVVEGAESARNQVQYSTVAQADTTSGSAAQTVTLIAKDPGSYRIRANFSGAASDATATDTQIWISGPGQAVWGDQNPSQLQMKLDRQVYSAGDTATVAVASPYARADLYLSVVRDRVLYKTLIHINGSAPRVRIPISQAMFPNAAVEGVLVRRGAPLSSNAVQKPDSLVRLGMTALTLDLHPRYLSVRITPGRAKVQPGQQQTVRLQLRDGNGKAAQGQFTVIVADDAILQLSGYRPPDLVQTVFAAQPISTRYADNRPQVTLTQPSDVAQKGWGYGGGFLAGAASTRVRTHFVQLAYFNGSLQTDANGNASVSFTVPDNLTTWRVMAVAMTAGATPRFGNADTTFIATKPLVTNPLLPQFARAGDRFDGGLLLLNGTSGSLEARTQGTLTGALTFATAPAGSVQAQQSFGPGMNAWRFGMIAGAGDTAEVQFRTLAGSTDAFQVPFAIRNTDVTESVIDSGATTSQTQVPLRIGSGAGTVKVDVAGSLVPQVAVPAARVLADDSLTVLPALADRLSVAASLLALQANMGAPAGGVDAKAEAAADVAQLASLQRIDGGFAFWPYARASDASGSAAALEALGYARSAGVNVSDSTIARARSYAANVLADPARTDKTCTNLACRTSLRLAALQALAAAGDRRTDFLQSIFAQRASLGPAEESALGIYLQQTPGWRSQADTVAGELAQRVFLTGRYANVQPSGPWYGSLPQAQAAYLELLMARGAAPEDQDRALRALVAQSCRCGWPSLSDTAAALHAIELYAQRETIPNFTAELFLDGKRVGSASFKSASASKTFALPLSLAAGNHTLTLRKNGSGTLHYVVSYMYKLSANAPGRLSGLRVIRTVHPANQETVLATVDIASQNDPLDLPAGNVYDIGVEIAVDHPVDRVVITDPLPAGFEALDTSFQTTAAYYQPLTQAWEIDYQQVYRDRITAFAQHLDPGVYMLHYLVRSVTPGTYLWPGATAYLLDAPEQFGRSAFRSVKV
ncbi:MAG TPA: Ig-like domain-containing protein [Candidatus Rubrimentiphilum sp.]|nr:Ig-like domain-containing protein [Candidatus Rubrimentiphilum sp.]